MILKGLVPWQPSCLFDSYWEKLNHRKHINHWPQETGRDSQIYSTAIHLSFIKTVKGDSPRGAVQIKQRVPHGISATMLTGVRLRLKARASMNVNQVQGRAPAWPTNNLLDGMTTPAELLKQSGRKTTHLSFFTNKKCGVHFYLTLFNVIPVDGIRGD